LSSLVEVAGVSVRFGAARAVDGVDLTVETGEVLALVGESGSGKTTLIRTILGLQYPTAGSVSFQGKPVPNHGPAARSYRRDVQMVFQDPTGALNPRQTIYEAVAEGHRIHHGHEGEKEKVAEALASAGLRPPERFFPLYPHEVSGGQRQRAVIAGAMILHPKLLLADEPVASLDASIRGEILALLRRLVDQTGLTVLVVTHDLGLAWNIADRVAVMYLGRVVEVGPTDQILAEPRHPYTRALLSVVPEVHHLEPQILIGEIPDPTRIPTGCRFHPRCPVVAGGEADRLGILEMCKSVDPQFLEGVACHASPPHAGGGGT